MDIISIDWVNRAVRYFNNCALKANYPQMLHSMELLETSCLAQGHFSREDALPSELWLVVLTASVTRASFAES